MNTVFNILATFFSSAIIFFLIPFFVANIGEEAYGVWALVATVFTHSVLINMGLSTGISRYLSFYLARNDKEKIRQLIGTGVTFFFFVSIVIIFITIVTCFYIEEWFHSIPNRLIYDAKLTTLVVGFSWALVIPFQPFSAALCGLQRYGIFRGVSLLCNVIRAVVLVALLSNGRGILTLAVVSGASQIATRILEVYFAIKFLGRKNIVFWGWQKTLFYQMFTYGAHTILYDIGNLIIDKANLFIIGIYLLSSDVAKYNIVVSVIILLSSFVLTFNAAIMPATANMHGRDELKKVCKLSLLSQKYNLYILFPSMAFFCFMGREFLQVWVGQEYAQLWPLLSVLCVCNFFRLIQNSNFKILSGIGKHKFFGAMTFIMAVSIIVVSFVNTGYLGGGLLGVVWAMFVPMTVISGIILPCYANFILKIKIKDKFWSVWWPGLLPCLFPVLLLLAWKIWLPPQSWLGIIFVVTSVFTLTVICIWCYGLSKNEKKYFKSIFFEKERV